MRTTKVKIYSRYNTPAVPGVLFTLPTLTQQHFVDEVDINKIIARAINTGNTEIFTPQQRQEFYDTTFFDDYQNAITFLDDVRDDFSSLPSSVRKQFGNSPDAYVAFMSNPDNVARAIELGLLQGGDTTKPQVSPDAPSNPAGAPSGAPSQPPSGDTPKGKTPNSDA